MPPLAEQVRDFADRHGLVLSNVLENEAPAIRAANKTHRAINEGYVSLEESQFSDPAVGFLLNMLHRNFEHVEAAIVAFVSGSGAAADVIARASTESSVSIRYVLSGDRVRRLYAYFIHYLDDVDQQVRKWRAATNGLRGDELMLHRRACEQRSHANAELRRVIENLFPEIDQKWPKTIAERFSALGSDVEYRTIYTRMSAEVHADAEETLRYFIGQASGRDDILESMALESVWMSRLNVYAASLQFLKASMAYAHCYSMKSACDEICPEVIEIEKMLAEIAPHVCFKWFIGAPDRIRTCDLCLRRACVFIVFAARLHWTSTAKEAVLPSVDMLNSRLSSDP